MQLHHTRSIAKVGSRDSSLKIIVNTDCASNVTSTQEGTPPLNYSSDKTDAKSMDGEDIQFPTFNGNGAEDPEQHGFLCEVV